MWGLRFIFFVIHFRFIRYFCCCFWTCIHFKKELKYVLPSGNFTSLWIDCFNANVSICFKNVQFQNYTFIGFTVLNSQLVLKQSIHWHYNRLRTFPDAHNVSHCHAQLVISFYPWNGDFQLVMGHTQNGWLISWNIPSFEMDDHWGYPYDSGQALKYVGRPCFQTTVARSSWSKPNPSTMPLVSLDELGYAPKSGLQFPIKMRNRWPMPNGAVFKTRNIFPS